ANRMREMSIRKALGAGRADLIQQLLTESVAISITGGALGLLLTYAAVQFLIWVAPANVPPFVQIRLKMRVVILNFFLCIFAALLFCLAPAFRASRSTGLNDRGQSAGVDRRRSRGVLVACEVALAMMLAVGAGLLVKSLLKLQQVNPGFNPECVLT